MTPSFIKFIINGLTIMLMITSCKDENIKYSAPSKIIQAESNTLMQLPNSEQIEIIVKEIVKNANENNIGYFKSYLKGMDKGRASTLIQQIKASEIQDNYSQRIKAEPNNLARFDYHILENDCHFQIDLIYKKKTWSIHRMWFCR